jgi:c-di-GMP phosphodiesterase
LNKSILKIIQNKKTFIVFAFILGILLISVSITVSLILAKQQAINKETSRLRVATKSVLERMDIVSTQINQLASQLSNIPEEACSVSNVKKMQEMNVTSFLIKAIGHISGNTIDCSSMPNIFNGMNLGKPYSINSDGTRVWASLKSRRMNSIPYAVVERNGYAAVIVPQHTIEALGNPEISTGIFSIKSHVIFASKGYLNPEWVKDYKGMTPSSFIDNTGKYIIYIASNQTNRNAVISAVPMSQTSKGVISFAKILIPMGILIGLGVGVVLLYIAKRRYSHEAEMLKALKRNEFYLEYQPIIDLRDRTCIGVEALIRWESPTEGNVRPDLFIPLAEELGLICKFTQKVFELIAVDLGEILKQNPNFHVGINVSSADIQSGNLINLINHLIVTTGIFNNQIIIEATESGFLNDGIAQDLIKSMRDLGLQVAVDDFGTGYSSLSYLTKFELDYLKIDKSFVDALGTEAVTDNVAFHIIEMAKSLHLSMIAEGVETEAQAKILFERGVIYAQGWLFSKSLNLTNLKKYMIKKLPKKSV